MELGGTICLINADPSLKNVPALGIPASLAFGYDDLDQVSNLIKS